MGKSTWELHNELDALMVLEDEEERSEAVIAWIDEADNKIERCYLAHRAIGNKIDRLKGQRDRFNTSIKSNKHGQRRVRDKAEGLALSVAAQAGSFSIEFADGGKAWVTKEPVPRYRVSDETDLEMLAPSFITYSVDKAALLAAHKAGEQHHGIIIETNERELRWK